VNEKSGGSAETLTAATAIQLQLRRVLKERDLAREKLSAAPIHDLRVAVRRSRSLAEGFSEFDSHAEWRHLRRACKRLLDGLADLRDVQVMSGWARRLHLTSGTAGEAFRQLLEDDERKARRRAGRAFEEFGRKRWKRWSRRLPKRASSMPLGEAHFAALALRQLAAARELDARCRGRGSRRTWHALRVQLKRFRYSLESFLPLRQAPWKRDLKRLQSVLGDIHDLDVLREAILVLARTRAVSPETRQRWLVRVEDVRRGRMDSYRRAVSRTPPRQAKRSGRSTRLRRTLLDRWRIGLEKLIDVNLPDTGEVSRLPSSRGSRGMGRTRRLRDTQRQPS
jgi:CHAD domain-containing protein